MDTCSAGGGSRQAEGTVYKSGGVRCAVANCRSWAGHIEDHHVVQTFLLILCNQESFIPALQKHSWQGEPKKQNFEELKTNCGPHLAAKLGWAESAGTGCNGKGCCMSSHLAECSADVKVKRVRVRQPTCTPEPSFGRYITQLSCRSTVSYTRQWDTLLEVVLFNCLSSSLSKRPS